MSRVVVVVGCLACAALGAGIVFSGEALRLPMVDEPAVRLLALALIAVPFIWLIVVLSRLVEGPLKPARRDRANGPMLMKAPRFHSDRKTGASYVNIRGQ